MISCEFVIAGRATNRHRKLMKTLAGSLNQCAIAAPSFKKDFLFLWGAGGYEQKQWAARQRKAGGQVVFFDLGYFGRGSKDKGSIRMSLNAPHPQDYLDIAPANPDRFSREKINLENFYSEDGHIVLIGLGRKSRTMYGYHGLQWENAQIQKIKLKYPEKSIVYRAKPKHSESITSTINGNGGSIYDHLRGASLAICHHSNVSVDCVIAGMPCVCFDGVGAAIWPDSLDAPAVVPSMEERQNFLNKVAYFNWYMPEARHMLEFISNNEELIRDISKNNIN